MNNETTEERFVQLETKILHQDFIIEELTKVVNQQEEKLHQLELTLAALGKRLRSAPFDLELRPHNEKPPHY